jgi:hypothetical protein
MKKIQILNKAELTDEQALKLVSRVVAEGKISDNGDCYCFCTVEQINSAGGNILILCKKIKRGYSFTIERK